MGTLARGGRAGFRRLLAGAGGNPAGRECWPLVSLAGRTRAAGLFISLAVACVIGAVAVGNVPAPDANRRNTMTTAKVHPDLELLTVPIAQLDPHSEARRDGRESPSSRPGAADHGRRAKLIELDMLTCRTSPSSTIWPPRRSASWGGASRTEGFLPPFAHCRASALIQSAGLRQHNDHHRS